MKGLGMFEGDLIFKNGDFVIVGERDVRKQTLEIEFGTNLGEWFLDITAGADYEVLMGKTTDEEAQAEVFRILGKFDWIAEINSVIVTSDYETRVRQIAFDIDLTDGENLATEVILDDVR